MVQESVSYTFITFIILYFIKPILSVYSEFSWEMKILRYIGKILAQV